MNFEEFVKKMDEEACTTSSVGNTPGNPGDGTPRPKDKKIAKRKPVDEAVRRAAPGRQYGHTAGANRGNSQPSSTAPEKMSHGTMAIMKKTVTHDDLEDLDLHPEDKAELMKHLESKKQHESYKIGDRVEILRDGYRFGVIRDINEEDGSYFVDPNSPISRKKDLEIINLGESEILPFVNIRKELEIVMEALNKKPDDDEDKDDDEPEDEKKPEDDEDKDNDDKKDEMDEDTKFILADLATHKEVNESAIKAVAFKFSLMSDITIAEAVEKVKAVSLLGAE